MIGRLHNREIDRIKECIEENGNTHKVQCWRVMYMEREKTRMNPPVLDWNWKLRTHSFHYLSVYR